MQRRARSVQVPPTTSCSSVRAFRSYPLLKSRDPEPFPALDLHQHPSLTPARGSEIVNMDVGRKDWLINVSQTEVGWVASSKAPRATESEPPLRRRLGSGTAKAMTTPGAAEEAYPRRRTIGLRRLERNQSRSPLSFCALIPKAFEILPALGLHK